MSASCSVCRMVLLLQAMACTANYDLGDVIFVDATVDEELALGSEVSALLSTMDFRDLRIPPVHVVDALPAGASGDHNPITGRIRVTRDDPGLMREALRHELCHALDAHLGRPSSERGGLLAVQELWARDVPSRDVDRSTTRARRREGFAVLCGMGAGPLAALAAEDHTSAPLRAEARWMRGVTGATPPAVPPRSTWLAEGRVAPPATVWLYDDGAMVLSGDTDWTLQWDGALVAGVQDTTAAQIDLELFPQAFFTWGGFDVVGGGTAWVDGVGAATVILPGASSSHLFLRDGDDGAWASEGWVARSWMWVFGGQVIVAAETPGGAFRVERVGGP